MIPVMQTRYDEHGNCFESCIASLLHLKLEEVPNLAAYEENGLWLNKLNEWLSKKGLVYFELELPITEKKLFFKNYDFYYIQIGKTTRSKNILHAVIGRKGKIVHDPFPKSPGLIDSKKIKMGILVSNCFNKIKE